MGYNNILAIFFLIFAFYNTFFAFQKEDISQGVLFYRGIQSLITIFLTCSSHVVKKNFDMSQDSCGFSFFLMVFTGIMFLMSSTVLCFGSENLFHELRQANMFEYIKLLYTLPIQASIIFFILNEFKDNVSSFANDYWKKTN